MKFCYTLFNILCFSFLTVSFLTSQSSIEWQKSIGTAYDDYALKIFTDPESNLVVAGTEVHKDLTGEFHTYFMITKMDQDGQEIWKKYHDIAFQTFSPPVNYTIGKQYYSNEFGQRLINFHVEIGNRFIIYKIDDETGSYVSYEEVPARIFVVNDRNEKTLSTINCSWQQSCYGPDSLTVQKFNEIPDSVFNFVDWTYEWKQDLRTAQIQGHYDIDLNDMAIDKDGNTYLLAQIERWDFNFCTDCADIFIDAHNMIFKFDTLGELVGRERLNITRAVVSHTQFVAVEDDHLVIRVDDINNAGTQLQNTIFHLNFDLDVTSQFLLDRYYTRISTDESKNIYALVNIYDQSIDPEIYGESDLLIAKFDEAGTFQWKSHYGGSSFDFPVGLTTTADGGIVFLANTSSNDIDVEENIGFQDMWLVKLREGSTAVDDGKQEIFNVYPNPVADQLNFSPSNEIKHAAIYDVAGKKLLTLNPTLAHKGIDVRHLEAGIYFLEIENLQGKGIYKFIKQ